jgi:hypothetical protein
MNLSEFQILVSATVERFRQDSIAFASLVTALKPLPLKTMYVQMTQPPFRDISDAQICISTEGREAVGDLLKAYPPIACVRMVDQIPFHRPLITLPPTGVAFTTIFPVWFNCYYSRNEPQHVSQLIWYTRLAERIALISVIICNDRSRVFESHEVDLPDGIPLIDEVLSPDGMRSASVYWPVMDQDEWLRDFCSPKEDEWKAFII